MPKEIDFELLSDVMERGFTPQQREWLARLLHDHVSGLVTNLAMQIEIVNKMAAREMDISGELVNLKESISTTSKHIVALEKAVRPQHPE